MEKCRDGAGERKETKQMQSEILHFLSVLTQEAKGWPPECCVVLRENTAWPEFPADNIIRFILKKGVFSKFSGWSSTLFLFGSVEEDHEQVRLLILIRLNGMEPFI